MKIGVLRAGPVNPDLVGQFGEYDEVFRDYLGPRDSDLSFHGWAIYEHDFPSSPEDADAWIISGSRYGVYEDHDWIEPFKAFIRDIAAARRPLIGVCFGHQIMAEALGGAAVKWPGGWGIGRHNYKTAAAPSWVKDLPEALAIHAVHQDQVTELPPDASVLASSDFCANAALIYGDPEAPYAISIQPHPEFGDDMVDGVLRVRRDVFSDDLHDAAKAGMGQKLHQDWAANWFLDFLRLDVHKK